MNSSWCGDCLGLRIGAILFSGACYNISKEIYVYDILHNHSRAGKSRADTRASPACLAARTLLYFCAIETGLLGFIGSAKSAGSGQKGEIKLFACGCTEKLQ